MTKSKNNLKKTTLRVLLALALCAIVCLMLPFSVSASEGDGSVAVNETNFPDATFRTYIAETFDLDADGVLSPEEIAAVTKIDISIEASYSYTYISDLTGIAYFTNLVTLNASGTNIASIDVSVFADLEFLYLYNCHYLKTLDLTANTNLIDLDVSGTGLTELDLSHNSNAGLNMGENTSVVTLEHCGMGYIDMSQFADLSRMTIVSGGTLTDGWLKLDTDATKVVYEYDTKSNPHIAAYFYVEIYINSNNVAHAYVDAAVSKDETGHYAKSCEFCRTVNETTFAEHTFVDGICACGYACVHTTHNDAGVCDTCQKQRGFSVTVGDSVSYFDDMIEAFDATTTGTEQSPATVKLLTNVTHTTKIFGVVSTGAYVVLDLNGYTLTFSHENAGIDVVGGSHFTLMDSSDGETGSIVADYTEQYPTGSHLIRVSEQSTMILESGRLVPAIYADDAILVRETSTLIQNGGVIEGTAFNAVSVYTGSLFTQNGGTIISNGYAVWIEDNGSRYVLEGGTLFLNGNWASGDGGYIDLNEGGAVTINGGVFDAVGLSGASVPTRYLIARGAYGDYEIIIDAATFKKADNAALCTTNGCYDGTITIKFKNVVFENGLALHPGVTETLGEYLAPGYVYYDENGDIITLTEGMTELTGKITVAECDHRDCTYTASGNVITETCNIENCSHSATATISAEDTVYNGRPHPATVTYSEGWGGGELVVSYSNYDSQGDPYTGLPVVVGFSNASISVGGATAEVQYEIDYGTPELGEVFVVSPSQVYNTTRNEDVVFGRTNSAVPGTLTLAFPSSSFHSGSGNYDWMFIPDDQNNYSTVYGTIYIEVATDAVASLVITTPPNKVVYTYGELFDPEGMFGKYTYLSGMSYEVDLAAEIAYNLATVTPEELTVATTEVTITYMGVSATQAITVNPMVIDKNNIALTTLYWEYTGEPVTVYFTVWGYDFEELPASEYTVTYTNNTEIGKATVHFTDNPGGNYEVNASLTFEIVPATIENVSVSQAGTLTYTGGAQTPTVNASATTVDGAAVTFTYSLEQNGTYTAELPTFTNAGTYTVWFKANAERHEEASGSFEVVVEKATNTWTDVPRIEGWTYGAYDYYVNAPAATAKFGNSVEFAYRELGTTDWGANPPTEAGSYEMRAYVPASDNWELLETIVEFEIKQATPTADIFDFAPPANLDVCDGSAKEATVTVKEGVEGVGSITIKYFKGETELTGAPTTVGTYTVKIEVAEGANYNASKKPIEDASWTFTFDVADEAEHTDTDFDSVCDDCGADVTHIEFSKVSLTLGGDIGINYFFTLGDTVLANEAYFLITYPDGSTEKIAVSRDLLGTPKGDTSGNTYYKVTARVAAKEMADDVKVELFVNEIPVKAFNYSIQKYAQVIFADASSEAGLIEIVKKMLNYGAASQVALGYNTDKLANSVLSDEDKTVNAVDASALAGATTEGTVSGFEYQMFSCILETKTTLRQYFTLPEGSVSEYTFTIDGESVTPIKTTVEGKTMYYIDVANIAARDMDVVHTLVITKGDETRTITCSVHSYMKAVLTKNSEDTELVNTVNAMYEYNQAAKQYLDQTFN